MSTGSVLGGIIAVATSPALGTFFEFGGGQVLVLGGQGPSVAERVAHDGVPVAPEGVRRRITGSAPAATATVKDASTSAT
jgi:hypothetical protein